MRIGKRALLGLGLSLTAGSASAQVKEWRIGALFSFSGPGAFLGQDTFRGAEIAADMINEQGGINGAPIVWTKADAGTPTEARSEAERLADDGIKVVFGMNNSALALAASQILERKHVIFWEPASLAEELTTRGYQYTFRMAPPGSEWAYAIADFALDRLGPTLGIPKDKLRIAIKYEDGAFGNSLDKYLVSRLKQRGADVVANEQYSARATDLSSLVLKLKDAKPDIIISTDYPNDATLFARQSKELGLQTRAIVGWAGIAYPKFREDLGDYAEGMMSVNMLMDLDPSRLPPETRAIRAAFHERYRAATGHDVTAFAASGFDGAWTLFKYVLPKAGRYDADAIREAAMSLDLPDGTLTQGWGVKFSDGKTSGYTGQNLRSKVGVTQWQDGKLVLVAPESLAAAPLRAPK